MINGHESERCSLYLEKTPVITSISRWCRERWFDISNIGQHIWEVKGTLGIICVSAVLIAAVTVKGDVLIDSVNNAIDYIAAPDPGYGSPLPNQDKISPGGLIDKIAPQPLWKSGRYK